jgi:hypothetical protein
MKFLEFKQLESVIKIQDLIIVEQSTGLNTPALEFLFLGA